MENLQNFLDFSITPYHAVYALRQFFKEHGFVAFSKESKLNSNGSYFIERGSTALLAFKMPKRITKDTAFKIVVSHSDFPGLKITPNGDSFNAAGHTLHPEIYGSPILSTWFDRDLGLAGNIVFENENGALESTLFKDESLYKIPNLSLHLMRERKERSIDTQTELNALVSFKENLPEHLINILKANGYKKRYVKQILSFDARLFDATKAKVTDSFISSARLDNLLSAMASVKALLKSSPKDIAVVCILDNEEIGSKSRTGAGGNFLKATLSKIFSSVLKDTSLDEVLEHSFMLSADAAHAAHPEHLEAFDENHVPILGQGVVLKQNASQRYATDIYAEAYFKKICETISFQTFVCRNDIPCGSTVGPMLSANLGIPTVDVGVPILGMHSIRETAHFKDYKFLELCAKAVLDSFIPFQIASNIF